MSEEDRIETAKGLLLRHFELGLPIEPTVTENRDWSLWVAVYRSLGEEGRMVWASRDPRRKQAFKALSEILQKNGVELPPLRC